jgi:hypothetical protein
MNICVIGDRGYGQRSHFSENITLAFRELGYKTDFLACEDIQSIVSTKQWKLYRHKGAPVNISEYLTCSYNLIFIDQCDLFFNNDLESLVFHNIKYVHRRPSVDQADVLFFLTQGLLDDRSKINDKYLCYKTQRLEIMASCTELDTYQPKDKKYKGISWFGSRNNIEEEIDHPELMGIAQRTLYRWEEALLRKWIKKGKLQMNMFETPVPTLKYRELLPQCEAMFMSIPRGQFVSRMMFEAMACKTLYIIEIQSERHEQTLRELGFINGEHYIGLKKLEDIMYIDKLFTDEMKQEIVENAYNLVVKKHTYTNRAKQILEVYNPLKY